MAVVDMSTTSLAPEQDQYRDVGGYGKELRGAMAFAATQLRQTGTVTLDAYDELQVIPGHKMEITLPRRKRKHRANPYAFGAALHSRVHLPATYSAGVRCTGFAADSRRRRSCPALRWRHDRWQLVLPRSDPASRTPDGRWGWRGAIGISCPHLAAYAAGPIPGKAREYFPRAKDLIEGAYLDRNDRQKDVVPDHCRICEPSVCGSGVRPVQNGGIDECVHYFPIVLTQMVRAGIP